MYLPAFVPFPVAIIKYPDKSYIREERVIPVHKPVMTERFWCQELEARLGA